MKLTLDRAAYEAIKKHFEDNNSPVDSVTIDADEYIVVSTYPKKVEPTVTRNEVTPSLQEWMQRRGASPPRYSNNHMAEDLQEEQLIAKERAEAQKLLDEFPD